jgi:LPS export ABC transporter protein LptC
MRLKTYKHILIPVVLAMTGILFSCVNDLESIQKVTYKATDPDERTSDLHVFYTDSGMARVEIFADLAEKYSKPEVVLKMKDGLKVHFYNEQGEIVTVLTALYGEMREESGKILVRDSVQLYNYKKKQRLETEELNWDRRDSTIFTNKPVLIRTQGEILFGLGIRTKQDFSEYEFIQPNGKINLSSLKKD